VFLSTVFLLQDSENVFELQPVDRLIVMKNIFNLIGIDSIKNQISDRRREIQTTLKVKSDTSNLDLKIKSLVTSYVNDFKKIQESEFSTTFNLNRNDKYIEFMQELEVVSDKVNINEFGLDDFSRELHKNILENISDQKK
jgi:hypothetical protein